MAENALLVDPLAALFRAELAGIAPLMLDGTVVEVEILPPLARVAVTRTFTNPSGHLLEAILTLPPAAIHEVIYGLTVTINGRAYHATAEEGQKAQRTYDAAIDAGRRAIQYERLADDIQLISITGIEAGAQVAVRIESILPIDLPGGEVAMLTIPLTAEPEQINARLADADALVTVTALHQATLSVIADRLEVTLEGTGLVVSGESYAIDCARPVALRIVPMPGRTLDRTGCRVRVLGGWEVSTGQLSSTLFSVIHPSDAHRHVISGRTDWIFGQMGTRYGEVWVTAPAANAGGEPPSDNTRAVTAFAAACFLESAVPRDYIAIQRAANILTHATRLLFIGDEGELPGEVPVLRKLALPHDVPDIMSAREPESASLPYPPDQELEPASPGALPPPPHPSPKPGVLRPTYPWLTWGPIILVLLWAIGQTQIVRLPLLPLLVAFVALMILNALRFFPRGGEPVRRRLPLLLLLSVPWIVSLLCGPLALAPTESDLASKNGMILFQQGLVALSILLPVGLLPALRGAWRFTGVIGVLNLLATFLATTVAIIANSPSS